MLLTLSPTVENVLRQLFHVLAGCSGSVVVHEWIPEELVRLGPGEQDGDGRLGRYQVP